MKSIDLLDTWMVEVDTDPILVECTKGRSGVTTEDICQGRDIQFCWMVADQEIILWVGHTQF